VPVRLLVMNAETDVLGRPGGGGPAACPGVVDVLILGLGRWRLSELWQRQKKLILFSCGEAPGERLGPWGPIGAIYRGAGVGPSAIRAFFW